MATSRFAVLFGVDGVIVKNKSLLKNIAIGGSERKSMLNFDAIINKFNAHNLIMPEIIFWNLRGDTGDFPVSSDTPGVTLLSGFSPTLLNSIMTNVTLTPYDILRQILDNPRYNTIVAPINLIL